MQFREMNEKLRQEADSRAIAESRGQMNEKGARLCLYFYTDQCDQ